MTPITPAEAKQLLAAAGVSQRKVSERTGVCCQYVSEWLSQKRRLDCTTVASLTTYFEKLKLII